MTVSKDDLLPVQRSFFDLDSFETVTVQKEFNPPDRPESVEVALSHLGNDANKLLEIIHVGMIAEARRIAAEGDEGWLLLDDEGNPAGPFTGIRADNKAVNSLRLTLAKTTYGLNKDSTPEQKKAAKQAAMDLIASTPAIKEGLRKSAAK
jgi:hypothetical protein